MAPKPVGEACTDAAECESGFCPGDDGICCDRACDLTCEACRAAKTALADGTCAPVVRGWDPEFECQNRGPASCGATGNGCNGDPEAPGCLLYPEGTVCAPATCVDGQAKVALTCDGNGTCTSVEATARAPYSCDQIATACLTACSDHADCDGDHYCSDAACVPKKAAGDGCTEAAQCASGFCPEDDLVCCESVCDGTCEACLASKNGGANGTCGFVTNNTNPDGECGPLQSCNGSGVCTL